jgi:lipopolysaccharide transport system ATP-binding protein
VDEVLAVGDAEFQKKCLGKMGDVAHEGRTVLFVSHNMAAIKRLCLRSIYLENGTINSDGETNTIVDKYVGEINNLMVADFQPDTNKIIRIRRLEVHSLEENKSTTIDTADGIIIKVIYDVNHTISGAHVFLRIHTSDGETLIGTGDADTLPSRLGIRQPGQYIGQVIIPPRILGAGNYTITWSAGKPFQENFDVEFHAIGFHVTDSKTERGKFIHRERPGLLGLDLNWNYE